MTSPITAFTVPMSWPLTERGSRTRITAVTTSSHLRRSRCWKSTIVTKVINSDLETQSHFPHAISAS